MLTNKEVVELLLDQFGTYDAFVFCEINAEKHRLLYASSADVPANRCEPNEHEYDYFWFKEKAVSLQKLIVNK